MGVEQGNVGGFVVGALFDVLAGGLGKAEHLHARGPTVKIGFREHRLEFFNPVRLVFYP